MKFCLTLCLAISCAVASAQMPVLEGLSTTDRAPENLLASRSVVIHNATVTEAELAETQKWFQQAGIDAVAYFDYDYIFAGPDFIKYFSDYCISRTIPFVIFFQKNNGKLEFTFAKCNGKKGLLDRQEVAWKVTGPDLLPLLRNIYQTALGSQKKQNFLVNDVPERDVSVRNFAGRRNESFSLDVRSYKVAVPRWGNASDDAELESYLKSALPVKLEFVDPNLEEKDLRQAGFVTVLRFVRTRGSFAKELLGYDLSQVSNAINSVVNVGGQQQVKTLPADQLVYKFYFKHLETNNAYLGMQWDADITWQAALRNHVEALRVALRIN